MLLAVALPPFLGFAFGFDTAGTNLLLWVTRAFLVGLLGHCMIELGSRIFFAQQDAIMPMASSGLNLVIYLLAGILLAKPLQAPGVGLADAIAFTAQAIFLFIIFQKQFFKKFNQVIPKYEAQRFHEGNSNIPSTIFRTIIGTLAGSLVVLLIMRFSVTIMPEILAGVIATALGILVTLPFIFKEFRVLLHL
jgi:putative peptidoglycan lipid II flippase